jgi:hypothetical protein
LCVRGTTEFIDFCLGDTAAADDLPAERQAGPGAAGGVESDLT